MMHKDVIYIAGALNGEDCCEYIQNLHRMQVYGEKIRDMGASIMIPGNDLLSGLLNGHLGYEDYINNSMSLLSKCDAIYLTPHWQGSEGTKKEIAFAESNGIPVLKTLGNVKEFLKRPWILTIVGESGTGKTLAADYFESKYKIPMIRSYTDRAQRYPDEDCHTFLSKELFDKIPSEDKIVPVTFGGHRYCCLHSDIKPLNTYVIEENGYLVLKTAYNNRYRIKSLRIHRDNADVDVERQERDKERFNLPDTCFDIVIHNNGTVDEFYNELDKCF